MLSYVAVRWSTKGNIQIKFFNLEKLFHLKSNSPKLLLMWYLDCAPLTIFLSNPNILKAHYCFVKGKSMEVQVRMKCRSKCIFHEI